MTHHKQTALVTGANKGIGYAIAEHLGRNGWFVIVGARHEGRATAAVNQLRAQGIDADWVMIDLCNTETLEQAASTIRQRYGGLDLLVNNAGIPGDMSVDSLHTEMREVMQTVEVNYTATFWLTRHIMPLIQERHGRIVNITVPSAANPYWHPLAYVASKAAQNAMMEIMALEMKQQGIPVQIYSVHPGPTTTDLNGNMDLEGFHKPDVIGEKVVELLNDGHNHNGEFIELYPIVDESGH